MEGFQVWSSKIIGEVPSDFEAFSLEPGKSADFVDLFIH